MRVYNSVSTCVCVRGLVGDFERPWLAAWCSTWNVGDQCLVATAIVFAVAANVAGLAAHVARLDRVGAVARDVSRFVAVVARHVLAALRL